jgi:uncharacterized repeat protein (TIGR02059 family)
MQFIGALGTTTASSTPIVSSASVNGSSLTLTYSVALSTTSIPSVGAFTVKVNGNAVSVSSVAISGSTVTLTLAAAVVSSDTVTVSYTVPVTISTAIQAAAGTTGNHAAAPAFTNQAVTNNTPAPNQDTAAFTMSLSPNNIAQGDTFTVQANINSASVQTYSISALQNGQNLGNLLSGVSVGSSNRPVAISQSFKTSSAIPTGTYTIKISNDANFNQFQTAILNVNSYNSSSGSSLFSQNGTYSGNSYSTNYNTGYNSGYSSGYGNTGSNIIFLYPTSNVQQRTNSIMPIHWGYSPYISGNIDLYLQTVCSNGVASCTPSTSLITYGAPVASVYYSWTVPSYVPANSWAVILAKQGSTVVGYSPTFIITQ